MEIGSVKIEAGAVTFALHHRYLDGGAPHQQGAGGAGGGNATQGMCIQVMGTADGKEAELLRFDCFDDDAHYHYGPEKHSGRIFLDPTVAGNPIGWTIKQIRSNLPAMVIKAGYPEIADRIDPTIISSKVGELETMAREMDAKEHHFTRHQRGEPVIEAGNIRFGLEMRTVGNDGGPAIHLMADIADNEVELIAFDAFRIFPHYHYGPRYKNERIFLDTTLVGNSLDHFLDWFKDGRLPDMIARAGYPTVADNVDTVLLADKLKEIEATIKEMAVKDPR